MKLCPLTLKVKRRSKKSKVSSIFKNNENMEAESLYIIQQSTNFSKLWYSFKSSVKAFKPYHCHKLILNNINKIGIFQRCIQNSVNYLRWRFSQKQITTENCLSIFAKRFIFDVWQGSNTPLYSSNYELAYTRETYGVSGWTKFTYTISHCVMEFNNDSVMEDWECNAALMI